MIAATLCLAALVFLAGVVLCCYAVIRFSWATDDYAPDDGYLNQLGNLENTVLPRQPSRAREQAANRTVPARRDEGAE